MDVRAHIRYAVVATVLAGLLLWCAYLTRDAFVRRWHDYDVVRGQRLAWERLGIVLRGTRPMPRYPAAPTPIE